MVELGSPRSFKREKRRAMQRITGKPTVSEICAAAPRVTDELQGVRLTKKLVVSEIYSPPRITKELHVMKSKHFSPGLALDFTVIDPLDGQPWDFDKPEKRARTLDLYAGRSRIC